MAEAKRKKMPSPVARYMRGQGMNEEEVRGYILREMEVFRQIPRTNGRADYWVALKMGFAYEEDGERAIQWATNGAQ